MAEEKERPTEEEGKPFRTGRKRKYATVEEIEAIGERIGALQETIGEFTKGGTERLTSLEENQAKIVKALTTPSGQGQGQGQGTGNVVADMILGRVMNPPSFLEKLAQRAIVEDLMFGRAIRRSVLNRLGKQVAKEYSESVSEALGEIGQGQGDVQSEPEGTQGA